MDNSDTKITATVDGKEIPVAIVKTPIKETSHQGRSGLPAAIVFSVILISIIAISIAQPHGHMSWVAQVIVWFALAISFIRALD